MRISDWSSDVCSSDLEQLGSAVYGPVYAESAARVQYQNKDPRGWQEFAASLAAHDALGSALTLRGVQAERPALDSMADTLRAMQVPALIIAGDEDDQNGRAHV